jgi:hypothetical protein
MYPDMRISQPAAGFAIGQAGAQPLADAGRCRCYRRFQPCNGILRQCQRAEQWMRVIGLFGDRPAAGLAGRFDFVVGLPDRTEPKFVLFVLAAASHFSEIDKLLKSRRLFLVLNRNSMVSFICGTVL